MLTAERLRRVLSYEPDAGLFRWRENRGRMRPGTVAGHPSPDGYIRIRIDGRAYQASRLAWLHVTGEWPKAEIDHRNGRVADNRWSNLRAATRDENALNRSGKRGTRSGFKGVSWHIAGNGWRAEIMRAGRSKHLGIFPTPEQAHAAYCAAAKDVHGEFARSA